MLRVPLIIAGVPGQRRGATDDALVETSDIGDALLDLSVPEGKASSPLPRRLADAHARFPRLIQRAAAPNGCRVARTREHKLMRGPQNEQVLFRLADDPLELMPLSEAPPGLVEEMNLHP